MTKIEADGNKRTFIHAEFDFCKLSKWPHARMSLAAFEGRAGMFGHPHWELAGTIGCLDVVFTGQGCGEAYPRLRKAKSDRYTSVGSAIRRLPRQ